MTRYALIRNDDGAELCTFDAETVDAGPGGVHFAQVVEIKRRVPGQRFIPFDLPCGPPDGEWASLYGLRP